MKLSRIVISILIFCARMVGLTFAGEIKLNPSTGSMGDGCKIAVDIIADTEGKSIAASDVIMESSMEFVDFVPARVGNPGTFFPYFLPPKVVSNIVHIVGFSVEPSQRFIGKHVIGTAYFKKISSSDRDGSIRLYFTKTGDTIDSNLSVAGGIDVLDGVGNAYYTFDGTSDCIHGAAPIEGGIKDVPLDTLLKKISLDAPVKSSYTDYYWIIGLLFIILLLLIIYLIKKIKNRNIKQVTLSLFALIFIGGSHSVLGQYYYFDSGTVSYPYQQGCSEELNVRINMESHPDGAVAGLLRLIFDPLHFSYSLSTNSSVLRTGLFVPSTATFSNRTSDGSPSWEVLGQILQIDRNNGSTAYKGTGLYGTLLFVPVYSGGLYTGFMSMAYDGGTDSTSLSKAGGINIINPASQTPRLTGIYEIIQEPCVSDTISPAIAISVPTPGTRKSYSSGLSLSLTDPSLCIGCTPYVFTGGGIWTGNVWSITNQYGINLNTFSLTLSGNGQIRIFSGSQFDTGDMSASLFAGPSGKTWQFLDKNYALTLLSGELFDYGIEKTITITGTVKDRKNNVSTISLSFNIPVAPSLTGVRSPNDNATFVDVNAPIKLGIKDDRAGVDSGTIRVTLSGINGTLYGPYVFSGNALNLSAVVGIADYPDYFITVSGHNAFPSSGTIRVIVYAQDKAGTVDAISDYSFTTRPSCAQLGCCNQISIQTGTNVPVLYDPSTITISGGYNPVFSTGVGDGTGYINCNLPVAGMSVYNGKGTESGSAQFVSFLDRANLIFSGANNVKAVLAGNTIYLSTIFVPPPLLPSPGAGGGGGGLAPDNCFSSRSLLPGANSIGQDNSNSLYDNDCSPPQVHSVAPISCDVADSPYDTELTNAYVFAYGAGITTICPITDAKLGNPLIRRHYAKMLVYFAVKVLGIVPDTTKQGCDIYPDVNKDGTDEMKFYTKTACQLEIMGMESDGITPLKNFMPYNNIRRAQLVTSLSRVLFGRKYNGNIPYWYSKHMEAFKKYGLVKNANPDLIETRGNVILMFKRAYDSGLVRQFRLAAAAKNGAVALKDIDLSLLFSPYVK